MGEKAHRYYPLLISICFVAAIIAVYWPVYNYNFVKYDDDTYVTNNTNIQSGLNWKSICWAFTTGYASNWHPVTWLSHILDYQLFGSWAGGHHLTNILFHILNTIVLFYVLMRMTGAIWPSAFVAAVFALHPLHVESVAWVAERKDLLSTFFWLLTMWAYILYVKKLKFKWYLTAFLMFVLGLMSKPMLVTIPFVLLLLDYWPLGRKFSYKLVVEKTPFFICSIASCTVTYLIQKSGAAITNIKTFGVQARISNIILSYATYIGKMIWPGRLAVLYLYPVDGLSLIKVGISGLVLLLISIYFIYAARHHRFLTTGWLWYLGTLVPVIGLVQVGAQAMADRYTYITLTGLFIIIAWGAKELAAKRHSLVLSLLVVVLAAWALTASRQLKYWKNSLTLFEHTTQITENNFIILNNYIACLNEAGRFDEAIEQFSRLLKMKPDSPGVHNDFGFALLNAGRVPQAAEHFQLALKYKPDFPQAYYNFANALKKQGRFEEAVSCYKRALKLKPDYIDAYINLTSAFISLKKFDEAAESCNKVLEFDPCNVFAHGHLSMVLANTGKIDEAIKEVRFVLNFRPNDAQMHRNLGLFLESKGQIGEAIKSYRTALQIDPDNENLRQLLDAALKKRESVVNK